MIRHRYQLKETSGEATRPSRVLPDQSLSIDEIMRRFVRGIPADVVRREGVYIDDESDMDMEQVSRMDFAQKAALAAELRDITEAAQEAIERRKYEASERAKKAAEEKSLERQAEASEAKSKAKKGAEGAE